MIRSIRFWVVVKGVVLILLVFVGVMLFVPEGVYQTISLDRNYGFLALGYLYCALFIGPLTKIWKSIPKREAIIAARRPIGVLAFVFGALHTGISFFGQLNGFEGLAFLPDRYLTPIVLGAIALVILFILSATSFDRIIAKMTFLRWKLLHRLVYIAGVVVVLHTLMIGTHFTDPGAWQTKVLLFGVAVLLLLEAKVIDDAIAKRKPHWIRFGPILVVVAVGVVFLTFWKNSLSVHGDHLAMQQETAMPGMNMGTPTGQRYNVEFQHDETIRANTDAQLSFKVTNASSGSPVTNFIINYEKLIHMVVVDSELKYFRHVHPDLVNGNFVIKTQFPKDGNYRVYVNFMPLGEKMEQQFGFSLKVGNPPMAQMVPWTVDKNLTKKFGDYDIALDRQGLQAMTFHITKAGNPVTDLRPYLGAFGHLSMINTETYEYIHIHPSSVTRLTPESRGGPDVQFLPMAMMMGNTTIQPGVYRLFAQFNTTGEPFVADYTIRIE